MAFGKHPKLEPGFKDHVIDLAGELGCDPSHLMAAMAFETGETFSPSIRNKLSGATGLIQFMPATAKGLGTTTADLAQMSAVAQLAFVRKHFLPFRNRLQTLADVYMTILFPVAVGKPAAHVLFARPSVQYEQNAGLDANKDGTVTKEEAAAKVQAKLLRGMKDEFRG
ncbi:MAG: lytic transglycosylase [Proteobacteria bacterium]|nr:lytic transglycosylase [Pseudomonadota bacterium]